MILLDSRIHDLDGLAQGRVGRLLAGIVLVLHVVGADTTLGREHTVDQRHPAGHALQAHHVVAVAVDEGHATSGGIVLEVLRDDVALGHLARVSTPSKLRIVPLRRASRLASPEQA